MSASDSIGAATESIRFQEVLQRWGPVYLDRFGSDMPPRQRQVLQKLLACRTPALGGTLFVCPDCGTHHYAYHSCNDRHCPQCGQTDADQWLARQASLLLPVPYFLATFTVPEPLRYWIRSNPALGLELLFSASARALQDLAQNPDRLGASLGMLGVLHTWSRTLIYHPHVHYLVPGGGLSADQRQWIQAGSKFLVHVRPLGQRFRTLFRQALEQQATEALEQLPSRIWKQPWVVHCQSAGSGHTALKYLSRYVFKTATDNRWLPVLPDGRLRWGYRDSQSGKSVSLRLEPLELIRRFLQHILPAGFHRVRRFGWLRPARRVQLNRVRGLLRKPALLSAAQRAAWQPPGSDFEPPEPLPAPDHRPLCLKCQRPMIRVGRWLKGQLPPDPPARAPPSS